MADISPPLQKLVEQNGDQSDFDFARFGRAAWAAKYWIAAATVLAFAIGIVHAIFFTTPVFTANARLVLEIQQNNYAGLDGVVTSLRSDTTTMNTEFQVMKSPSLMKKVVQKYDLHKDPTFAPWLREDSFSIRGYVRELISGPAPKWEPDEATQISVSAGIAAASVNVWVVPNTRVITISSTTTSPTSSQKLSNALAEEYILNQIEVKFDAIQQATEWLAQRVAALEASLKEAQSRYQSFVAERNILSAEEMLLLSRQLNDIRNRIKSNEESISEGLSKATELRKAVDEDDLEKVIALTNDPSLARMIDLLAQGQDLEATIDARIDTLAVQAEKNIETLRSQTVSLRSSADALSKRIDRLTAEFSDSEQLAQEVEASRAIYEYVLNRLKETSVQSGVQKADARILSEAGRPGAPSAPNKNRIILTWTVRGLMIAFAVVLGLELLNRGYRTSESIEADTGQTVLGQIPKIEAGSRLDILKYLGDNPNSAAAEAFRNLRTSILLSDLDSPPKVIMSTSSLPAEGKTVQAFALAMNLAAMGRKVLLMEGDVRRGIFTARLGYEQGPGLIGVLAKQVSIKDALIRNDEHGFDILIGGKARTNPVDLFSSHAFDELIKDLREEYDVVIIDSPPLLAVPDARVIGQHVDAIVYSIRWNATTRAQVREGLALLETVNLKVAGFVLSQVNLKTMRNYGYGAYGNYGGKYYTS